MVQYKDKDFFFPFQVEDCVQNVQKLFNSILQKQKKYNYEYGTLFQYKKKWKSVEGATC